MENKSEYGCVLIINTEEQHPEIVTKMTGVKSTSLEVRGEPRIDKKTGKERNGTQGIANLWKLDTGSIYGSEWESEKAIRKLLDIIDSNTDFKTVFMTFKESFLRCYAYVYHYNITFELSPIVFYDLYKIGLPIEFDLYSFDRKKI